MNSLNDELRYRGVSQINPPFPKLVMVLHYSNSKAVSKKYLTSQWGSQILAVSTYLPNGSGAGYSRQPHIVARLPAEDLELLLVDFHFKRVWVSLRWSSERPCGRFVNLPSRSSPLRLPHDIHSASLWKTVPKILQTAAGCLQKRAPRLQNYAQPRLAITASATDTSREVYESYKTPNSRFIGLKTTTPRRQHSRTSWRCALWDL